MSKGGDTPTTPDYISAALAQGNLSRDATLSQTGLNRPNEVGPYGTRTWSYTPATGTGGAAPPSTPMTPASIGIPPRPPGNEDKNYGGLTSKEARDWDAKYAGAVASLQNGTYSSPTSGTGSGSGLINPGDWTVTTELSPEQQRLYNLSTDYQTTSGEMAGRALENFNSQGNLNFTPESFGAERSRVEDAMYDRATRLYGDQFSEAESSMRDRLVNQGLDENSEAFKRQVRDFDTTRYGAYQDAADRSVLAGGQEQSRMLANLLQARGSALNEAQSLASGGQVQLPNFQSYGQAGGFQAPDIMGATEAGYNADLGAANASNAAQASNTQGAMTLASMLAMYY